MVFQNKKRILVYACDPGGANVVIPVVQRLRQQYDVLLYGKAAALQKYQAAGLLGVDLACTLLDDGYEAVRVFLNALKPDLVVTGTSANDFTERYLWKASQTLAIPSYALLDQWMNNDVRFSSYPLTHIEQYQQNSNHLFLPQTIFVLDDVVKQEMVSKGFDKQRLMVVGHTHLETIAGKAETFKQERARYRATVDKSVYTVAFFSEPIEQTYGASYWGYTEKSIFLALQKCIHHISANINKRIKVIIKLHPREEPNNFNAFLSELRIPYVITQTMSVWDIFVAADLVCGMSSMALLEAMVLGLPVVSIQIGLQRPDPFMPSLRGINVSMRDQQMLEKKIESIILDDGQLPSCMKVQAGAVDRVIKEIGRVLC